MGESCGGSACVQHSVGSDWGRAVVEAVAYNTLRKGNGGELWWKCLRAALGGESTRESECGRLNKGE